MASLTGASIASSYTSLLKLSGNTDTLADGTGSNAIQVVDGDGTASPLYLNTDRLGIGGQPTVALHVKGDGDRVQVSSADYDLVKIGAFGDSGGALDVGFINLLEDGNERIKLLADGSSYFTNSLGIGTSSPAKPIHISSSDNQPLRVESTDAYAGIQLKDNGSSTLPPLISALLDDLLFYGGHASSQPLIMYLDSSTENVGIKTTSPLQSIDAVGKVIIADNKSDDTAKVFGILGHQYDSGTETEGYGLVMGYSDNSMNRVQIGGGNSDHNSATVIKFFTGANTTTRTGTERMSIDSSGNTTFTGDVQTGKQINIIGASTEDVELRLLTDAAAAAGDYWKIMHKQSNDALLFQHFGTGAYVSHLALNSDGSVHIGANSDEYLHAQNVPNHVANTMSSPYYKFDGTGDAISVGDASSTMGKIYSASVFFYIEDAIVADTAGGNGALFTGSGADDDMLWIGSLTGSISQEIILVGNSSNATVYQASSLSAGHHHIAISWDGTQYDVFLDGTQVTTTNAGTPALLDSDDLIIGNGDNDSDGYGSFNGQIHSINLWNKSLTATEVKEMYSGASVPFKYKGANQTSLVTGSASDFSADDYYSKDTGITVASNVARWSSAGNNTALYKASLLTVGKAYNITFTIVGGTYVSGGVKISIGNSGTTRSSEETFTETVVATSDTFQLMSVGTTTLDVDNVFIRPAGAVAEYDGSGIASDKWFDKSGNDLHGTVSGSTVENAPSDSSGLVYEEGTFTPTITGITSVGYASQSGFYTRIGNMVSFNAYIETNSGTLASANVEIQDLPFTSNSTTQNRGGAFITYKNNFEEDGSSGHFLFVNPNTTTIEIYRDNGTRFIGTYMDSSSISLRINGFYYV